MYKRDGAQTVLTVILIIIFGGIVLHAPLSVMLSSWMPAYSIYFKAWKEVFILIGCLILGFIIYKKRKLKLLQDPIIYVALGYVLIHILSIALFFNGWYAAIAGLMIDLRYVVFFVLVYVSLKLHPDSRNSYLKVGIVGALIVIVFGFLQVFFLPYDFLSHLGYNKNTIIPYLVVDQSYSFIRINSTLRGPNPLGAYVAVVLIVLASYMVFKAKKIISNKKILLVVVLMAITGSVTLWSTYSRSALVATIIGILLVVILKLRNRLSKKALIISGFVFLSLMSLFLLFVNRNFLSSVLLHSNINSTSKIKSDDGHIKSLTQGVEGFLKSPFGSGVGSTGSASLHNSDPLIIENQYLFTSHEVGWIGLFLFILLFVLVLRGIWKLEDNWIRNGVFVSGIALALIGLLLPVWVDDTVCIVWWGLAAVALTQQSTDKTERDSARKNFRQKTS